MVIRTIVANGSRYSLLPNGMGVLPHFDFGEANQKPGGGRGIPASTVVERVVKQLRLPQPLIRTSPDMGSVQVVRVPTWLWVERSGWRPVSTSVAVNGVTVTATARPIRAVWSIGDGGGVVCSGPGTPYSDAYRPERPSPDCGYTYQRTSRSAPGGAFPVSVRVVWNVDWHGGGRAGSVPGLVTTARRQLVVDEVQAVVTR